ncbi:MAG: hypothetical protein K0R67_1239, partial [Paenibacillus sp.]|nr:hypothetical protein [Paenibacillus sp.]
GISGSPINLNPVLSGMIPRIFSTSGEAAAEVTETGPEPMGGLYPSASVPAAISCSRSNTNMANRTSRSLFLSKLILRWAEASWPRYSKNILLCLVPFRGGRISCEKAIKSSDPTMLGRISCRKAIKTGRKSIRWRCSGN